MLVTENNFHKVKLAIDHAQQFATLQQSNQLQEFFETVRVLARNERQDDWLKSLGKLQRSPFRMKNGRAVQWQSSDYLKRRLHAGKTALIKSGKMFNNLFLSFDKQHGATLRLRTPVRYAGSQNDGLSKRNIPSRPFAFISTELRREFSARFAYNIKQMLRFQGGVDLGPRQYAKVRERHKSRYTLAQQEARRKRRREAGLKEEFTQKRSVADILKDKNYDELEPRQLYNAVNQNKIKLKDLDQRNVNRYLDYEANLQGTTSSEDFESESQTDARRRLHGRQGTRSTEELLDEVGLDLPGNARGDIGFDPTEEFDAEELERLLGGG